VLIGEQVRDKKACQAGGEGQGKVSGRGRLRLDGDMAGGNRATTRMKKYVGGSCFG